MPALRQVKADRIIAVGGGKGGVGKSVVAANLAVAIAQTGKSVILFDADLGAANQHTLFGIERPGPGVHGLVAKVIEHLSEAVVATDIPGVSLIPGSAGIAGAANIKHAVKLKILRHLLALNTDVLIIDVGAGMAYNALDFFDIADLRVVVMTPQLTSIQNAYSFLKSAVHRQIHQLGQNSDEKAMIIEAENAGGATEPVTSLVNRLRGSAPSLVSEIDAVLTHFGCRIAGNFVFDDRELSSLLNVGRLIRDYLGVHATLIGSLRTQKAVHESVNRRRPYMAADRNSPNAREFQKMARLLLAEDVRRLRRGRAGVAPQPIQEDATGPRQVVDALL